MPLARPVSFRARRSAASCLFAALFVAYTDYPKGKSLRPRWLPADMTLQCRVRSLSDDRGWQQRVRLSRCLLAETVDWWCRTGSDFPVDCTVAGVLYVFSPRCDPFSVSETRVRQNLCNVVGTPDSEYSLAWPHRADCERLSLIDAISRILSDAVQRWDRGGLSDSPIELVNQQIVDEIVIQRYVVFHHNETTRRDFGGFYGSH